MSKGNAVWTVRIGVPLSEAIEDAIERRNKHSRAEPWTFSDFIRQAIQEKLAHMSRSRKKCRQADPGFATEAIAMLKAKLEGEVQS